MLNSVDVLEHILRPREITSCSWMNVDVNGQRLLPHTCACYDIPDQHACVSGYANVRIANKHEVFEKDPDTLAIWCVDNVPKEHSNNETSKNSWSVGCFNGIRGPHKIV